MGPDYSKYTIEELFQALSTINKQEFPERYEELKCKIADKQNSKYRCPKCDFHGYEHGEIRAARDVFESFMELEGVKFFTVSCLNCGYTEIYKRRISEGEQIFDFIF